MEIGYPFGLFSIMQFLTPLFFLFVMGYMLIIMIRSILEWNKNNHSPRLTVEASVVSKRTRIRRRSVRIHNGIHDTYTTYYATFQVESGDRMEFVLSGSEYGMLAEGDQGKLSFQGTRFLSFERSV